MTTATTAPTEPAEKLKTPEARWTTKIPKDTSAKRLPVASPSRTNLTDCWLSRLAASSASSRTSGPFGGDRLVHLGETVGNDGDLPPDDTSDHGPVSEHPLRVQGGIGERRRSTVTRRPFRPVVDWSLRKQFPTAGTGEGG